MWQSRMYKQPTFNDSQNTYHALHKIIPSFSITYCTVFAQLTPKYLKATA